jgi:hypothetical protein
MTVRPCSGHMCDIMLAPRASLLRPLATRRPPAATLLPTDVAGLLVWYEDSTGLWYQDNPPTVPAVNDGDPVKYDPDQSGAARNLIAPTDAKRPTLKKAAQNGRDTLLFDGTDDALAMPAILTHGIGTGDYWWLAVIKSPAAAASFRGFLSNGLSQPTLYVQSQHLMLWEGSSGKHFSQNMALATWHVVEQWRIAGTASAAVDGVVDATTFASSYSWPNLAFVVGNDNPAGGADAYNSHVAAGVLWKHAPTLTERQGVVNGFGQRWGIAVAP